MALTLLKGKEEGAGGSQERNLAEIALRVVLGLVMNFLARRIKQKSRLKADRRKAMRKVEKLARKGREVPEELKEAAWGDLPRREKKKLARKAAKKAKKKARKAGRKRGHKLLFLLLLVAGVAVAVSRMNKK